MTSAPYGDTYVKIPHGTGRIIRVNLAWLDKRDRCLDCGGQCWITQDREALRCENCEERVEFVDVARVTG